MSHLLLLMGVPGVGKTTVVRRAAAALSDLRLGGFATDEIRRKGRRLGFLLRTFDGREQVLAHVDFPKVRRVGRYGIAVEAMDAMADSLLSARLEVDAYLVDEIGKMECLSARFVSTMRALLDSHRLVVATIAKRGSGFIAEAKRRPDAELWEVTTANRDDLPDEVVRWLRRRRASAAKQG